MSHGVKFWTREREEKLLAYIDEGQSFQYAAAMLGCTRNAAIGKHGRLKGTINSYGYATAASKEANERRRQAAKRAANQRQRRKYAKLPKPPSLDPMPKLQIKRSSAHDSVVNLKPNQCRWPFGDPRGEDFGFCSRKKIAGKPYCQEHYDMSWREAPKKVRR